MSINPDNKTYIGLGAQSHMPDTTVDSRYLIPSKGMLRFIERETPATKPVRVLQMYDWSAELGGFDWFDVPSVHESEV